MAPRAYWKGFLRLSLVSCPIQLFPATSEREKVSFNQINAETGNRIRYRKVDEHSGEDVEQQNIRPRSIGVRAAGGDRTANRHRVAFALQNQAQGASDIFFVINNQDPLHDATARAAAGSSSRKAAPPSSPLTRRMSPPHSRALLRAIERPNPIPPFLKEMVGSNSDCFT